MPSPTLVSAALLSFAALAGCAQNALVKEDASSATYAACAAAARKTLHDHGIERGYGPMPVKSCMVSTVADSSTGTAGAAMPRHDHGRFHKNQ